MRQQVALGHIAESKKLKHAQIWLGRKDDERAATKAVAERLRADEAVALARRTADATVEAAAAARDSATAAAQANDIARAANKLSAAANAAARRANVIALASALVAVAAVVAALLGPK